MPVSGHTTKSLYFYLSLFYFLIILKIIFWTSLVVKRLKLCASNAGGAGSIPGQGTMIPHAVWHGQKFFLNK